jgi:gas vesicle protein
MFHGRSFLKEWSTDMEKANIGNVILGCCIGVAAGILLAPQSGKTTRGRITKAASDSKDAVHGYRKTVQGTVVTVMEHGKDYISRQRRGVTEAIKRGSEAYRRTA